MKTSPIVPLDSPEPVPSGAPTPTVLSESRAMAVIALGALLAMLWIIRPVILGILVGMITAFTLQPFYERLKKRTRRPRFAAGLCVLTLATGSISVAGALSSLFLSRGAGLAQELLVTMSPGGGARLWVERAATHLGPFKMNPAEVTEKLAEEVAKLASSATYIASEVASATFDVALALMFAMMTLYYILNHWSVVARRAEDVLPIKPRHTRALLVEFQRVGRTTLLGTVLTGIGQGVFAAVGYGLAGVPEATFFGAATAVASLVPGVGTMLVWIPAGIFLLSTGHPFAGTFELLWGSLIVVGLSDYVIRPGMVGGDGPMPTVLTFAALFGGVEIFGLAGLIFGPLIMAISFAILGLFAQDADDRRRVEGTAPVMT